MKISDSFLMFAQNIDCGYTLYVRGAFGKYVAWYFTSVTNLATRSCFNASRGILSNI